MSSSRKAAGKVVFQGISRRPLVLVCSSLESDALRPSPLRLSTCNDVTATIRIILRGLAIGSIPVRLMQPHVEQGTARELNAVPTIPPYEVWVCWQVEELGPGLRQVVDIIQSIAAGEQLYV